MKLSNLHNIIKSGNHSNFHMVSAHLGVSIKTEYEFRGIMNYRIVFAIHAVKTTTMWMAKIFSSGE